ncbi:uncharacterized protein [Ptychodera flava]|uniref:uncharacterized protein n=1 Tax=Ptychodera flava TaxID=63121 RepID=UPI003969C8E5
MIQLTSACLHVRSGNRAAPTMAQICHYNHLSLKMIHVTEVHLTEAAYEDLSTEYLSGKLTICELENISYSAALAIMVASRLQKRSVNEKTTIMFKKLRNIANCVDLAVFLLDEEENNISRGK